MSETEVIFDIEEDEEVGDSKVIFEPYCKGLKWLKFLGLPLKILTDDETTITFKEHRRFLKSGMEAGKYCTYTIVQFNLGYKLYYFSPLGLVVIVISLLRLVTFLHGRSPGDTVAEFKEHGVHLGSEVQI